MRAELQAASEVWDPQQKAWGNVFFLLKDGATILSVEVLPEVFLFLHIFFCQKIYTLPKTYMEPEKMLVFEKERVSSRWPQQQVLCSFFGQDAVGAIG